MRVFINASFLCLFQEQNASGKMSYANAARRGEQMSHRDEKKILEELTVKVDGPTAIDSVTVPAENVQQSSSGPQADERLQRNRRRDHEWTQYDRRSRGRPGYRGGSSRTKYNREWDNNASNANNDSHRKDNIALSSDKPSTADGDSEKIA